MDRLRLAFVPGVTPDKWARVWRERHPDIRLELLPVAEDRARAVLDEGTADLCLARLPVDREHPDPLHCVELYEELPVAVASRDHLLAAAEKVTIEELEGELRLPPDRPAEAVETAAAGTGYVVLPMSVARLHHRRDVVQVPVTDLPPTRIGLVWRVADDSPVHQDLVGVVRGRRASSGRGEVPPPQRRRRRP